MTELLVGVMMLRRVSLGLGHAIFLTVLAPVCQMRSGVLSCQVTWDPAGTAYTVFMIRKKLSREHPCSVSPECYLYLESSPST